MKKYIFSLIALLSMGFVFTSCDPETNEPAGGNKIVEMTGDWVVTVDAVDDKGNVLMENVNDGPFTIQTFATANDDIDVMWLQDDVFWGLKFLVPIDYNNRTFSCVDLPYDPDETGHITITNGKVTKNGGVNIHGKPVDAITFDARFDDDKNALTWRYHGVRYQGFTE